MPSQSCESSRRSAPHPNNIRNSILGKGYRHRDYFAFPAANESDTIQDRRCSTD